MNIFFYIIIYLLSSAFGLIFLKSSLNGQTINSLADAFRLFISFNFILGLILYVTSFVVWIFVMSRKDLSYIYPIVIGLSYVIVMTLSWLVLKESLTIGKALGALIICIGVIIITLQK